jgi:hypothetical protein
MAEDFLIETTNESGIVRQERVYMNETELELGYLNLVRIDGLERATELKDLYVLSFSDQLTLVLVSHLTHSRCSFAQLPNNRFVDVPACVLASTQLTCLNVSRSLLRCRC